MSGANIYIGTAGWQIPPQTREMFIGEGTNLEKYGRFLNAVEINSSFYREHKHETYRKWAASVPDDFRFTVKLQKYFTREKKLTEAGSKLQYVLEGVKCLEEKLGALLVQLPGRLEFDARVAEKFLIDLRKYYDGEVVWEPRHVSWASRPAADLLSEYSINKVLADPEPCMMPKKLRPQVENLVYLRLHGTPEMYKSRYTPEVIDRLANVVRQVHNSGRTIWCMFDNTTYGYALENALELIYRLEQDELTPMASPKSGLNQQPSA